MSLVGDCIEHPGVDFSTLDSRMVGPGGPFELVPDGVSVRFRRGPHTMAELIEAGVRHGERPFIVMDEEKISHAAFTERAKAIAASLSRGGVGPGARVALSVPNSHEGFLVFAGLALCGASIVLPPPGLTDRDLEAAGCALHVLSPAEARAWVAAAGTTASLTTAPPYRAQPHDEALIAFTSGTSGKPKPVRQDHRAVMSGLRNMMLGAALAVQRRPRGQGPANRPRAPSVLTAAPFQHVGGYGQFLLMAMLGGKLVALSDWDGRRALSAIATENVQALHGLSSLMAHDLIEAVGPDRVGPDSVSAITLYGAAPSAAVAERLASIFPRLETSAGYGLTETNGSVAVASAYDLEQRPGTAGRLSPATEIRIVDAAGAEAAVGQSGEIWLRGPMVAQGYGFNRSDHPAFRDGWFRTGDIGFVDADRFLYLAERSDETILSCGRRISSLALEEAAQRLPGVREAAAFGIPDTMLGQRPGLAVAPAQDADIRVLRCELASALNTPGLDIFIVDRLDRTASGKVDRRALARRAGRSIGSPASPARPR